MKKLLLMLLCVPLMFSCGEKKKQTNGESEDKESSDNNSHIDMERCTSFFLKREEENQKKRKEKKIYKADRDEWYSCLCEKLLVKYESFDNIIESGKDGSPDNKDMFIFLECMEQLDMSPYQKER